MPALIAAATLSGCPGSGDEALILWHAWGGAELQALQQVIADFKRDYPTQHGGAQAPDVMALQVPYDQLKNKFLRSAAANGGPDVLIGDADWSGKFATSGLLREIHEVFSAEELKRFVPSALASLEQGGRHFALPESREVAALYFNKALLPTPPKTLDALFAEAPAAAKRASQGGSEGYGLVYNAVFYYTMGYYFGLGGQLFQGDQVALNSPGGVAALGLVGRVAKAPGCLASHEYSKGDSMYKEGRTAMILNGPWALRDYQKALGAKLGVAPLPDLAEGKPARPWVGVKCVMMNANAEGQHRVWAKDFMLALTSPAGQKVLMEVGGHIPAVQGVLPQAGSPLAVFAQQAEVGTPVNIRPETSQVWEPMDKAIRQVIQSESSPEAALEEAQKMVEAKVKAMRAARR